MKVVSVNIGAKQLVDWRGKQVATGIFKKPVNHPIFLEENDVKDDHVDDRKHHGGSEMACYIYSADHYKFWMEKYPSLDWDFGMFGENITIGGLDEKNFNIGDVYKLGDAIVQISQPRKPCFKLGIKFGTQAILKEYINSNYPGIYLRVLSPGKVSVGDSFQLSKKNPEDITLLETYHLQYNSTDADAARIKQILNSEIISKDVRNGLMKRISLTQ